MSVFKVTAPEAGYSGPVGKVQFRDGSAEIDDERNPAELNYCRNAGYLVEEVGAAPEEDGNGGGGSQAPAVFDPAEHNADEVLAYLNDADEAEATRVLDAETAGKARKGITDKRDAILASKQKEGEDQ